MDADALSRENTHLKARLAEVEAAPAKKVQEACRELHHLPGHHRPWRLVYCRTHVRRRFVKRFENEGSPIAEEVLRRITLGKMQPPDFCDCLHDQRPALGLR